MFFNPNTNINVQDERNQDRECIDGRENEKRKLMAFNVTVVLCIATERIRACNVTNNLMVSECSIPDAACTTSIDSIDSISLPSTSTFYISSAVTVTTTTTTTTISTTTTASTSAVSPGVINVNLSIQFVKEYLDDKMERDKEAEKQGGDDSEESETDESGDESTAFKKLKNKQPKSSAAAVSSSSGVQEGLQIVLCNRDFSMLYHNQQVFFLLSCPYRNLWTRSYVK